MLKATDIKKRTNISKEAILERLSEKDIFQAYFPEKVENGRTYINPLRKDKSPGCSFYTTDKGRLIFHDFAKSQGWDCFSYIMDLKNINFWEALKLINERFDLKLGTKFARTKIEKEEVNSDDISKKSKLIQVSQKEWTDFELTWWKQFSITKEDLDNAETTIGVKIISANRVYMNKKLVWRATASNPIIAYIYPSGKVKCYRPLSKDKNGKWLGSVCKDDITGVVPFMVDTIIITKSVKDVLVFNKMGYCAIAPQNEDPTIKKSLVESLFLYNCKVFVLYDNDATGKENSERLIEKYSEIIKISIPEGEPKDISDYVKKYGLHKAADLIINLINNDN